MTPSRKEKAEFQKCWTALRNLPRKNLDHNFLIKNSRYPERKLWRDVHEKSGFFSQYNSGNREPLFVLGGLPCTFWFRGSQSCSCGDC